MVPWPTANGPVANDFGKKWFGKNGFLVQKIRFFQQNFWQNLVWALTKEKIPSNNRKKLRPMEPTELSRTEPDRIWWRCGCFMCQSQTKSFFAWLWHMKQTHLHQAPSGSVRLGSVLSICFGSFRLGLRRLFSVPPKLTVGQNYWLDKIIGWTKTRGWPNIFKNISNIGKQKSFRVFSENYTIAQPLMVLSTGTKHNQGEPNWTKRSLKSASCAKIKRNRRERRGSPSFPSDLLGSGTWSRLQSPLDSVWFPLIVFGSGWQSHQWLTTFCRSGWLAKIDGWPKSTIGQNWWLARIDGWPKIDGWPEVMTVGQNW